ncbi:hypothetical protein VTO42DRAFT_2633 [Malbranchea cinnamomea]
MAGSEAKERPSPPSVASAASSVPVNLEVDETIFDKDSSYGDDLTSYTASLTSSVLNSQVEYGRTFHTFRDSGGNAFPSDEQEQDRLDIFHALMVTLLDGKLHLAPLKPDIQRAIDLGTGTGIWAIQFADDYPSAEVLGVDLTPIQPNNVPPNLKFILDDIEHDWEYERNPFDYVHARFLSASIRDWPRLMKQAFDCLKPGGWVEFQDWDGIFYSTDGSVKEDSYIAQFCREAAASRDAAGYVTFPGKHLEKWIKDAGFVNVHAVKLPVPLGTWPRDPKYKRVGAWNYYQFDRGMDGMAIGTLLRNTGTKRPWTMEEIQVLMAHCRAEMKNPKVHGQFEMYVVYGQKPENP